MRVELRMPLVGWPPRIMYVNYWRGRVTRLWMPAPLLLLGNFQNRADG